MTKGWQQCIRPLRDSAAISLCISLNKKGNIAISGPTWREMGRPHFALLMYDPQMRRVGLKPSKRWMQNVFPFRQAGQGDAKVIRASRLMKQFGIELEQTVRFTSPEVDKNGVWVLDLNAAFVPENVRGHWKNQMRTSRGNGKQ